MLQPNPWLLDCLARHLARLKADFDDVEIHLVSHSAGSIALGEFLAQLGGNGLKAESVSLYAPACTVDFALKTYLPAALSRHVAEFRGRSASNALETDWLAGHVGFEPANPCAPYVIGIT
jgi:hypothetical protein